MYFAAEENKVMDMKKRRDLQLAYIADETIMEEQRRCRKILQKLLCKL